MKLKESRIIVDFFLISLRLNWYRLFLIPQKDLMMSKQDVKDETKMTEGDPQVKSKIRSLQLRAARRRMRNIRRRRRSRILILIILRILILILLLPRRR